MPEVTYIDKGLLKRGDLLSIFRLAYALDPDEFKKQFANVGIDIVNDNDLEMLVELAQSGGDKLGVIRKNKNQPIHFSVMDTFGKINVHNRHIADAKNRVVIV